MTQTNMPFQQLGNYRLIRLLGRGGFADVYLGQHMHLKSYAAIKVLRANLSAEGLADLFLQEAQTIANLAHPNIVRVMDFDVQGDTAFLIMEYAPYGSLRRQYRPGSVIPLEAVLSYTRQVAAALYYAHQQRIIHRDVKPENMLVGRNSGILLSDFGLALLAAESSRSQRTGEAAGTVGYVAPEQIEGKPRPASDQYALSITVYEWLCGVRPFHGTIAEVTMKHLSSLPPPLRAHDPSIPPEVEAVVLQALEKDPAQRFATVQEFARALQNAAGEVRPRPRADERFFMPQQQRAKPDTLVLPEVGGSRGDASNLPTIRDRDLASVRTVVQQQQERSGSSRLPVPGGSLRVSRRTMLLGLAGIGVIGVGTAAFAALHPSAPAARVLAQSTASPGHLTPIASRSASPSASPTKVPTPTPDPVSTATQVQAPAPTQPPTPTPNPTPSGTLFTTYRGHSDAVYGVAWSPDGTRVASASADGTTQEWYAANGSNAATYNRSAPVGYVAWSPDGTRIASASDDKTIQIYDTTIGSVVTCSGHTGSVHSAAWSPDSRRIASGSSDNTVKVWDTTTGNLLQTYHDHTGSVWVVAWSPGGTRIASASTDNTVKIWNVTTGVTPVSYSGHTSRVIYVAWSPDGRHLASGSDDTTVQVWSAATGTTQLTYRGHNNTVYGVMWSPDGTRIASGGVDTTVHVWDAASGAIQFVYRGHSSLVFGVAWSPDGTRIASASSDRTVQIWQA